MELYPHQIRALEALQHFKNVALYWDMGLGKTYGGGELLNIYGKRLNLVICQKSKIQDWVDHFNDNYHYHVYNLTKPREMDEFMGLVRGERFNVVGVINYELAFRRVELSGLREFTLLLDESSLIQNETTKRSKFILSLRPSHVILLSGTPTGGKYENLWSQMHLLGWDISKTVYWNTYVKYHYEDFGGFPVKIVDGYKNVDRLKRKMRDYGCSFLLTDDVINLPEQIFTKVKVEPSKEYKRFRKNRVVVVDNYTVDTEIQLVGDNTLTKMMYERQLCGQYSEEKLTAVKDLLESTEDRLIIFYNYNAELWALQKLCDEYNRPYSVVNGITKDLSNYNMFSNSVTLVQYQAGAMGLNLQKANKIIYYTPPLSSELYEQSKKRTHRIGQSNTCYYYNLTVTGSIEEKIYKVLDLRQDYTERLFEEDNPKC